MAFVADYDDVKSGVVIPGIYFKIHRITFYIGEIVEVILLGYKSEEARRANDGTNFIKSFIHTFKIDDVLKKELENNSMFNALYKSIKNLDVYKNYKES